MNVTIISAIEEYYIVTLHIISNQNLKTIIICIKGRLIMIFEVKKLMIGGFQFKFTIKHSATEQIINKDSYNVSLKYN